MSEININELQFPGSSNVYTFYATKADKLAQAVTITIGNKSVSFDGSSGITFTLDDIGVSGVAHTQASNTITSLNGYNIGSSSASISTTDSLNIALGKLEYKLSLLGNATTNAAKANTSAYNAGVSANSATTSAASASTSAYNASVSANSATTSAAKANNSAINAASSQTNAWKAAQTSAYYASTDNASAAKTSAYNANISAINANTSAYNASVSANSATTSAAKANNSAASATTSAATAKTYAAALSGLKLSLSTDKKTLYIDA